MLASARIGTRIQSRLLGGKHPSEKPNNIQPEQRRNTAYKPGSSTNPNCQGGNQMDKPITQAELNEWEWAEIERENRIRKERNDAIEQERILEASRAVRAGTDLLFAALRKNGVL